MFPRSRLVLLGSVATLLIAAAGCKTDNPTGPGGTDTSVTTRRSPGATKGATFSGSALFPSGTSAAKAKITVVDGKLKFVSAWGTTVADADGAFTVKPAPDQTYFVLAESADGKKLAGVVLPVVPSDEVKEPVIKLTVGSTLAVAGIQPLFAAGIYDLRDLPVDLFDALAAAVDKAAPTLDLSKSPADHNALFKDLYEKDAAVRAAYDAMFAKLKSKFLERNPGASEPPTPSDVVTPSPTPTPGSFASTSPTPTPTGDGSPTTDPSGSTSPSPDGSTSPTPAPTATPAMWVVTTKTDVTGQAGGVDIKAQNIGDTSYFNIGKVDTPLGALAIIPDNDRLWLDSPAGFQLINLGEKLGTTVEGVRGLAFDGTKAYMLGRVGGVMKMITLTLDLLNPGSPTVTPVDLSGGDLPNKVSGHALYNGSLYVAAPTDYKVYKVALDTGVVSVFAGTGQKDTIAGPTQGTSANLGIPFGLANLGKTLYIAEWAYDRILKADLETGLVDTFTGAKSDKRLVNGPIPDARFSRPVTLQATDDHTLLVGDSFNGAIRQIDVEKNWVSSFSITEDIGSNALPSHLGVGRAGSKIYGVSSTYGFVKFSIP